jgi:predicted methyltransferase
MRKILLATLLSTACCAAFAQDSATVATPPPAMPPPDIVLDAQAATPAAPAATVDAATAAIARVVAGDWRTPANVLRDTYRHPAETLGFFGVREDQTVLEVWPGGGWYTEILVPLLRERGKYVGIIPKPAGTEAAKASTERGNARVRTLLASRPELYDKAELREVDNASPVLGEPGSADVVLTFRNAHNWVMDGNEQAMFKAFHAVLRKGGTLGVVDHRAAADQPPAEMKTSGYLPEAYVIALAEAAGFRLAGKSEVNANPRDTKDYPDGVWTLPPRLAKGDVDRDKYLAIGESDRMTLRFVKD